MRLLDRVVTGYDQAFPSCPCFLHPAEDTTSTLANAVFLRAHFATRGVGLRSAK